MMFRKQKKMKFREQKKMMFRKQKKMKFRKWEDIPKFMKCEEVKEYYDILAKKRVALRFKRGFDIVLAILLLILLAVPMLIIAAFIKADSPGPVFYRQERVTAYGKRFRIHKFRTMIINADRMGSTVTVRNDARVTRIGRKIRALRIDELPQLLDVLSGNMSFVGPRPQATKLVKQYSKEMLATLLLPAGITSEASIKYKDEASLLNAEGDADKMYIENVLPDKMKYELESLKKISFTSEIATMLKTVVAVL